MEIVLLWVTAVGSALTAIATCGLVFVAARTLGGAGEQLELLQKQLHLDARPYVVLEIAPGLHGAGSWDLVVRNMGRTMAHHVIINIGAIAKRSEDDYITEHLVKFLEDPKTIAPGARIRVMWRSEPSGNNGREAGAPSQVIGYATYQDESGVQFQEKYDLSTAILGAVAPAPTVGPRTDGRDKELRNIENALRTISSHVGELRR